MSMPTDTYKILRDENNEHAYRYIQNFERRK